MSISGWAMRIGNPSRTRDKRTFDFLLDRIDDPAKLDYCISYQGLALLIAIMLGNVFEVKDR